MKKLINKRRIHIMKLTERLIDNDYPVLETLKLAESDLTECYRLLGYSSGHVLEAVRYLIDFATPIKKKNKTTVQVVKKEQITKKPSRTEIMPSAKPCVDLYNEIIKNGTVNLSFASFVDYFEKYKLQEIWIGVKEKKPQEREHILVCYHSSTGNRRIMWCVFSGGQFRFTQANFKTCKTESITHWMPLPKLPILNLTNKEKSKI